MPNFGSRSRAKLKDAHPRLIKLFEEVVKRYDCSVIESHRSPARQASLVAAQMSRTMKSKHLSLPSKAVDVLPWPFSSKDWKNTKRFYHFAGYCLGVAHQMQRDGRLDASFELVNGLDWSNDAFTTADVLDDQNFMDGAHFEIREFPERS